MKPTSKSTLFVAAVAVAAALSGASQVSATSPTVTNSCEDGFNFELYNGGDGVEVIIIENDETQYTISLGYEFEPAYYHVAPDGQSHYYTVWIRFPDMLYGDKPDEDYSIGTGDCSPATTVPQTTTPAPTTTVVEPPTTLAPTTTVVTPTTAAVATPTTTVAVVTSTKPGIPVSTAPSAIPDLPATGSSNSVIVFLAAFTLAAGAALLVVRRRY